MKTRKPTMHTAEESRWYESAARPSTPGEMTKAEPADLAQADDEENADADAKRRKMRWAVVVYVVVATMFVALGNVFDSIYWAAAALFFAISAQPRARVPKLLRYFATAAVIVLTAVVFVRLIMKLWGA